MTQTHYVGKQKFEQHQLPELLELIGKFTYYRNGSSEFSLYYITQNPQIPDSELNFRIDYTPKGPLDREYYINCSLFNKTSQEISRHKTKQQIENIILAKFFQNLNFPNCPHTGHEILTDFGGKNILQTLTNSEYQLSYLVFEIGDISGDIITQPNKSKLLQLVTQQTIDDNKKITSELKEKFGLKIQEK